MKRHEFEHTIRAAGAILGVSELLVIGSQAIHASVDMIIPEAQRSIEVDISALEDPDGTKADLIDGSIGELSVFQETFGYYAQGVTPKTAVLPEGWRKRLVAYKTPGTNNITALCLEIHDLWLSKAIAHREKDIAFCKALIKHDLVKPTTLKARLKKVKTVKLEVYEAILALL
ncbi:MAG: DUF6036 family nucleotidyltransferase [bacterium]|nr:hypothetical protein [bacterium]MBU1918191.1 hypothetical protein [bacterium]